MPRRKSGTFDNKEYQNEYHKKMKTKLISFNPNNPDDMEIWEYLQTVENVTGYIKDLIREDTKKEEQKMKWFVVDERGRDIFDEMTRAKTRDEAVALARAEWDALSAHDQKLRKDFYAALAEPDEDGHIDFETCIETVSVKNPVHV